MPTDTDLIVKSFTGQTNPGDLQLSDGDKALLIKLLSNSAFFPKQFESWLANKIPLLAPETTVSNVTGVIPVSKIQDYPADATKVLKGNATWGTVSTGNLGSLVVTDAKVAAANKDGTAAIPSMRTLGTAALTACAGDDARLSDARTPTVHHTTHVAGGSDVIANAVAAGASGLLSWADKTKLDCVSGSNTGDQTLASLGAEAVANKDTDGTLVANSDTKYASQKATKTYADGKLATPGAWTGWTPVLTASVSNPDLGAGSVVSGRYCQMGKVVTGYGKIKFGTSPNAGSGYYKISIPVTAYEANAQQIGSGLEYDSSAAAFKATVLTIFDTTHSTMHGDGSSPGAADPWVWAASDEIRIEFKYEAA